MICLIWCKNMASEKIKEYIEKTKKAGYNDEQIIATLKKQVGMMEK